MQRLFPVRREYGAHYGHGLCALLFVLLVASSAVAQRQVDVDATSPKVVEGMGTETTKSTMHSPKRALVLSAVLPGAGQVYNRQAWKIPIVYAGFTAAGYFIWSNYSQMSQFKTEILYRAQHGDAAQLAAYANYPTTNIRNMYETYNKNFQLSIIAAVAVYGLNLVDAYVFGHLFDFEISDDLALQGMPAMQFNPVAGPSLGLHLSLHF